MTLKTFLAVLNEMVKDDPSLLDLNVMTIIDEEGKGYNEIDYSSNYEPMIGSYDYEEDRFIPKEALEEEMYDDDIENWPINTIVL